MHYGKTLEIIPCTLENLRRLSHAPWGSTVNVPTYEGQKLDWKKIMRYTRKQHFLVYSDGPVTSIK
jgi:hypothetical protein